MNLFLLHGVQGSRLRESNFGLKEKRLIMSEKFTWIPFYEEMARKLMGYKDQVDENGNHSTLVEKIKSLNSEWIDFLRAKADNGDFADIDPFTVFAIFNRSSGMERRCAILKSFKELFGVLAEIPKDFDGIPLANAQKSCFYYEQEKDETIPLLWKLFDAFMNGNTTELAHSFDEAQKKKGVRWNLTMAFFWMKPNEYASMDRLSRTYLMHEQNYKISNSAISFASYISASNQVKSLIENGDRLYHNFYEFSNKAFDYASKGKKFWIAGTSFGNPRINHIDEFVENDYWEGGECDTEKNIKQVKAGDILIASTSSTKGADHKYSFLRVYGVGFVTSDMQPTAERPHWYKCDVEWIRVSPEVDFEGKKYGWYRKTMQRCDEGLVELKNFAMEKLAMQSKEEIDKLQEYTDILKVKHNIVLQGAPGTGKTYKTAELALSVIGELPIRGTDEDEMSFHKRIMEAYEAKIIKLNRDGSFANPDAQIGFVTFHQTMDYEDFVEGIKPIKPDEGEMYYKIEDGIFKIMSRVATNPQQVKQAKTLDSTFDDLIQDIIDGNVKTLSMKNGGSSAELSVSSQMTIKWKTSNGDIDANCVSKDRLLKLCEVYDSKEKIGAITNINETIRNVIGGCNSSYYWAVANYILEKIGKKNVSNEKPRNYVLIIDEINRGNVSKIFGELISLLEADKRVGGDHPLTVTLPYSKESFSVPSNLYIIGTMNTTDRSVGSIDYAVRRRFAFVTLEADENKVPEGNARNLFNAVKNFLNKSKYDMDIEDLMVGHSYFMDANNLQMKWQYEILPLLMEYHKDGIISKSPLKDDSGNEIADVKKDYAKFVEAWQTKESDSPNS